MAFTKAKKGLKPLKLVISGASGSGKSWTSLDFAKFLSERTGKRTAAIDTENGRLSLYADIFDFDVEQVNEPFHPDKLISKIKEAEKAGYGQFIVDSSTHFYASTGGLLEIVNDAAKNRFGGNQYAGWSVGTPIHNRLVDTIIQSNMHIIVTVRAKQAYVENEKNGRKVYEKHGYDMIQRDGLDYELDFCLMMDMDNNALVTKGMTTVPPQTYFKKPSSEAFQKIMDALEKDTQEGISGIPVKETKLIDLQEEIISLAKECGGSGNVDVKALNIGNPRNNTDIAKLNDFKTKLIELKNKQQTAKETE